MYQRENFVQQLLSEITRVTLLQEIIFYDVERLLIDKKITLEDFIELLKTVENRNKLNARLREIVRVQSPKFRAAYLEHEWDDLIE